MLPVAGVCVGTVQIVRGVVNQPEAIVQSSKGRVWDEVGAGWPHSQVRAITVSWDAPCHVS